jgi:hypothetical protein
MGGGMTNRALPPLGRRRNRRKKSAFVASRLVQEARKLVAVLALLLCSSESTPVLTSTALGTRKKVSTSHGAVCGQDHAL